jgi:hypothetical protein
MPLDTRIALGAQPLQLENQLAQYGQAVGIQNAMQQNQLGQMQMSAAQRAMQEEEGAKNFLSGNPDLNDVANQRRLLAFGKTGLGYAKLIAEQKKAGLEGDKLAAEILGANQKNFTALNSPMDAAARGPAGITDYVEALYKDPVLGPLAARIKSREQALAENQILFQKDPQQWVMAHANLDGQHLLDALKTSQENAAEKARIASLPPLPSAVPTGTVNATTAALAAPGAAPNFVTGVDSFGKTGYAIDGAKVSKEEFDAAKNAYEAGVQTQPVRSFGQAEPVNAMAPAAAAGNVNAMVAPTGNEATLQAVNAERKTLIDRLDVLERMPPSKGREDEIKRREARLKEIRAPINMRADGTTIIPGAGTLTAAAAPSDILRMRREAVALRASGDIAGADAIDNRIKKLNELADNRTASQKEQAVLDDPNSTKAQIANATSQLAKLNHIPEKAMSDFERGLAASNLPEAEKSKLRNAWLKSHSEHAPGTVVNIDQKQESAFATELGAGQAKGVLESKTAAQDAADILATNEVGRSLLKSGAITGAGADFFVGLNKALKQGGIDFGYADAAANSQAYGAAMAANTGKLIKQFGAGTGISDADRDYATQAAAGKITMDEAAIRKVLDINDRAARNVIERHNKSVKGIKTNIPLEVEMPTAAAPPAPSGAALIPGSKPAAATGGNVVTLPDGRTKTFPTAEAAAQFKKAAGL